jgi:hypothetical protein
MVLVTLGPAVARGGRYASGLWRPLTFTTATAIGGLAMGATLGAVGALLVESQRAALATALCLAAVVVATAELLGYRLRVPGRSRETPRKWMRRNPLTAAALNGVSLGLGWSTRIGFWLWFAVPLGSILSGSSYEGMAIYGAYGLTRGLGLWLLLALANSQGQEGHETSGRGFGEAVINQSATMRMLTAFALCGLGLGYLIAAAL